MMRKKLVMFAALLLCVGLGSVPAWGARISISPGVPSSTDSITVTAGGHFNTLCWNYISPASCSMIQPDTLVIQVSVNYCRGLPSCVCGQFPVDYTRACTAAPLAPGMYVAKFVELHVNPADPLPSVTTTARFAVSESTPASRRSWGMLKIMYR